jgi:ribosomal protein L37AE/L43A
LDENLIRIKDVNEYLRELIKCPFCKSDKLNKKELSTGSLWVSCENCGFELLSYNLYDSVLESGVEKGTEALKNVLRDLIQKAIDEYEEELIKKIAALIMQLDKVKEALRLHYDRL